MSKIALGLYLFVDGVNDTPFPSASNQAKLTGWQYNAKRMAGAPSITGGTITYASCLDGDWNDNIYVEYKGEKFFAPHKPTSSYSSLSVMYEHKVDFLSERAILDNVYFYDVVSEQDSDGKPISNSNKFTFFGTIAEFIVRLNASMAKSQTGYSAVLDPNQENTSIEKQLKFEAKYISEAMQEGFKAFGIPYYFVGKVAHFGDSQASALDNIIFEYGDDKSLISINKTNANNRLVNRITGTGSSENIPYYYPNSCEKGVAEIGNLTSETITSIDVVDDVLFAKKVSKDAVLRYGEWYVPLNIPSFYVDGEAYLNQHAFLGEELSNETIHVVVPFDIEVGGASNLELAFLININGHPSNLLVSPSIAGSSLLYSDNPAIVVLSANNAVSIGKYQLSFDVTFGEISQGSKVTFGVNRAKVLAQTWKDTSNGKYYYDLSKIGLHVNGTPSLNDSFKQKIETLIPYQKSLMPSIYRNSRGEESFYNADNNTYINPATGEYYSFENPYAQGKAKEYIQDNKDIKPSIKGMVNASSEPIDQIIKFAFDENDSDEIDEQGKYVHPYFFALLHKTDGSYGFNLFDHASDEGEMSLSMTSGKLGGCEFIIGVGEESQQNTVQIELDANLEPLLDEDGHPILKRDANGDVLYGLEGRQPSQVPQSWQNDTINNEVWVALKKEEATYGIIMPNASSNYRPDNDDDNRFVILHIDLPRAYTFAAEQALENYLIASMSGLNSEHWNFGIDYSRIYLKENPNVESVLDENKKIKVRYNGVVYSRYILSFSYRTLVNEIYPSINVELAESLEASSSPIDSQIDAVKDLVAIQANAIIGYQQIARLARLALPSNNVNDAGSPTLPIYFEGDKAKEINGLEVPNDVIAHRNILAYGGVAARGIPNLGMGAGGGQGDVTGIQFDSTIPYQTTNPYTAVDGLLRLPVYPSLAGMASQEWVAANFAGIGYESRVEAIEALIPSQATSLNQLADKAFVNSSIATATATYQGSYNLVSDLSLTTSATREQIASALASAIVGEDNNDYAFVEIPTSDSTPTQIASVERYKFNGTSWAYEYTLNNSGMTAAQWAALNSGITASGVALIYSAIQGVKVNGTLLTPDSNQIVNVGVPTALSQLSDDASHRLVTDTEKTAWGAKYDLPSGGIPKTDLAQGVQDSLGLADTALQSESDPVFTASAAHGITSTDINAWNAKQDAINDLSTIRSRADEGHTAYGYFTDGVANNAAKLGGQLPSYYAVASDYTKTTDFKTLTIKAGNNLAGEYSPTSALVFKLVSGSNINLTADSTEHTITIANTYSYTLPTAASNVKGGVKVGDTLYMTGEVLNAKEANASQAGIVNTSPQTFAGDKTFNGNVQSMKGIAAHGIANLAFNAGGGSGDVTSIKFGNGSLISASDGLLAVPVGQGTSNGQINIGGQDVSVKGLGTFAYISSLAFADITDKPATATRWPSWSEVTDKPGTFYTLPIASASVLGGIKVGANLSINSSTGVLSATDTTYTNGTGLSLSGTTFSISQANVSTILNLLSEGASPATRDDYIIAQYAGGGTTTTSYRRRKLSNVFAALNSSDVTTALGYTPFNNASFTQTNIQSTLGISNWALASGKPSYAFSEITGSVANNQLANSYIGIGNRQINLGSVLELSVLADDLALGSAASYAATNAVTQNSGSLVTSGGVYSYVNALLTAAMKIEGETTTEISDGSTTNPVVIGGQSVSAYKGMVVFYGSKEFVWVGTSWKELGDEGSFALKTTTVTGTGYLTGGGALSSNQTIDIASSVKTKIDNGATAYGWGNHANAGYALASNLGTASTHAHSDYVTGIGVSGNTLTWSKGGTAQTAITVPYATTAGSAPASDVYAWAKAATKPSYTLSEISSRYQSLIDWGGPNLVGSVSPLEVATIDELGHNKFAFASAASVVVQYSRDGGSTWTDYGTEIERRTLVTLSQGFSIGNRSGASNTVNDKLRVILNSNNAGGNIYTTLRRLIMNISTGGSGGCTVKVEHRTIANYRARTDTWSEIGTFGLSGWSGWNSIPCVVTFGGSNYQTTQSAQIRLTFGVTSVSSTSGNFVLYAIRGIGFPLWQSPSNMASNGHLYSFDISQNAAFPAGVSAISFTENGTTLSSKYLGINANAVSATKLATARSINGTSFDGTADITTVNWGTARNISIADNDSTNTGAAVSVNGSAAVTLKLPATIKATLSGNATSATKATQDGDGNTISSTYLKLSGGTMSNTNKVANLNADLLDGYHSSYFGYNRGSDNYDCNEVGTHFAAYMFNSSPLNAFPNAAWSNMLVIGAGSDTMTQIGAPYGTQELYFRAGTWKSDGTGSIRNATWQRIVHSGNISSFNAGSATTISRLFTKSSEAETASGYYKIATITHSNWAYCSFTMLVCNSYSGIKCNTLFDFRCSDNNTTLDNYAFNIIGGTDLSSRLKYLVTKDGDNITKIELYMLCTRYEHPEFFLIAQRTSPIMVLNTTDWGATPDKAADTTMTGSAVNTIVASALTSTSIGSSNQPVYFDANGIPSACSTYAGGTAVTLNGASKAANTASFYAPTGAGTSGQILKSTAGTPEWINQSSITAGALSTVSKILFGNTYWTSGGVPTSIGTSSSPAALYYVTNIDSIAYFDRTNSRLGIGTSSPSYKHHVIGDIYAQGGWLRTSGSNGSANGWQSQDYGGGWFCDDYTYVKTYGNRSIYTAADVLAGGNIVGTKGVASQGIANLSVAAISGSNFVTQVKIGSTAYNPSDGVVSLPAYPTVPTALSSFTNDVGYITGITSSMVTTALGYTPAQSDTKNTTGADNTTSKIYLVGPTAQTSSNGNARTYSNSECYASNGYLYSNGKIVANRMETPQPQSGSDTITLNGTEVPSYRIFDINSTSYLTKTLNHPSSHSAQNGFSYILISNSTASEATINMPSGCIAPASSFKIAAGKSVEVSYFYNGNNVAVIMWSTMLTTIS